MFASSPVDILAWQRIINGHRALTAAAKSVAFEISLHIFSATGTAWPSMKRLAERTNLDISTAKRAVKQLVRLGLIAIRRTGRSHLYRLIGGTGATSEGAPLPPERAEVTGKLPPSPQESRFNLDSAPEPALEPVCEAAPAPTDTNASPQAETAAQADSDAPDDITTLVAFFWTLSGTKADAARHRKALSKALKTNTPDEIETAAKVAKSTWSNAAWITPSAICKDGRVDELLSQAKATAAPRQAAHKLFERTPEPPRADPSTVKAGLSALKAALGR